MRRSVIFIILTAFFNLSHSYSQQHVSPSPDSIVFIDETKDVRHVYTSGEIKWFKYQKVMQYNSFGKIATITESTNNYIDASQMRTLFRTTFSYNDRQGITNELFECRVNDHWVGYTKKVHTYDPNGRLVESIEYYKDPEIPDDTLWGNISKFNYVYNSHSDIIECTSSTWVNYWENHLKWNYDYNSKHCCIKEEKFWWRSSDSQWVDSEYKYERNYNENGQLQSVMWFGFKDNQWVATSKNKQTYNNDKLLTMVTLTELVNGTWQPQKRITYTYNNNQLKEIYEGTFYENNWNDKLQSSFEYDKNGYLIKEKTFDLLSGTENTIKTLTYGPLNTVKTIKHGSVSKRSDISYSFSNNHFILNSSKFSSMIKYNLAVYNLQGEIIVRSDGIVNNGRLKFTLNPNQCIPGFYLCKISGQKNELITSFHANFFKRKK